MGLVFAWYPLKPLSRVGLLGHYPPVKSKKVSLTYLVLGDEKHNVLIGLRSGFLFRVLEFVSFLSTRSVVVGSPSFMVASH